jgi:L-type amino acid transporter 13
MIDILESSRLKYIAGQQGQLPLLFGMLNIHSSPFIPVLESVILGSIAIASTNLIELINYVFFVSSVWTILSLVGLLKLRYQEPNLHRPYKVKVGFLNSFLL